MVPDVLKSAFSSLWRSAAIVYVVSPLGVTVKDSRRKEKRIRPATRQYSIIYSADGSLADKML